MYHNNETEEVTVKRRFGILLFGAVLALVLLPFLTRMAEAQTITLKAVTAWPKNASDNKSLDFFLESVAQQVAKKYPGELEFDLDGRA